MPSNAYRWEHIVKHCRICFEILDDNRAAYCLKPACRRMKNKDLCPHCGGIKVKNAKQCKDCRSAQLTKEHRKPYNPKNTCPGCGGIKSEKAEICWKCYQEEKRGEADGKHV